MPANSSSASLCETMASIVGVDACLSSPEELFVYECDALTLGSARPALVVLPGDTHQVSQVVKACRRFGRPFVPRGAGTGLSGGAHPVELSRDLVFGQAHVGVAQQADEVVLRRREERAL